MFIPRDVISGLVLSGGQGRRMGGTDKGLQPFKGAPMAMHTIMRLEPQVDVVKINANRNLAAYESLGVSVLPDVIDPLLWSPDAPNLYILNIKLFKKGKLIDEIFQFTRGNVFP